MAKGGSCTLMWIYVIRRSFEHACSGLCVKINIQTCSLTHTILSTAARCDSINCYHLLGKVNGNQISSLILFRWLTNTQPAVGGQSLQQLSAVYMKIDIFRMWEWAFESSSIFLFNIAWLCALADLKQTISNMLFELFCVCTQKRFGFPRSFKDCVLENSHSWTTQLFPFNSWMLTKGIMWWRRNQFSL